jgi:uncharacterized membrane protein YhaH (DUF805 family)
MSDMLASSRARDPIDPKRPWITDHREDPAEMNWTQSFTNPLGETSRLHFTRGWTMLFFVRLAWWLGFALLAMIFGAAGVDDPSAYVPPSWAFLVLIVLTALASVVLHIRRLGNARRSPLWAMLVFVPVLVGFAGFMQGVGSASAEYDDATRAAQLEREGMPGKLIAVELERPGAARLLAEELLVRVEIARIENMPQVETDPGAAFAGLAADQILDSPEFAAALLLQSLDMNAFQRSEVETALTELIDERAKADNDGKDGQRSNAYGQSDRAGDGEPMTREQRLRGQLNRIQRQWRGKLPEIDVSQVSALNHAVGAASRTAIGFWAVPAFLVMLWSLLWVGRLPTGGGSIHSRFQNGASGEA